MQQFNKNFTLILKHTNKYLYKNHSQGRNLLINKMLKRLVMTAAGLVRDGVLRPTEDEAGVETFPVCRPIYFCIFFIFFPSQVEASPLHPTRQGGTEILAIARGLEHSCCNKHRLKINCNKKKIVVQIIK